VGQTGLTVLATVRSIDPIYAYFEISERQFARILEARGGHHGNIDTDDDRNRATLVLRETGHEIVGHLDALDNTVDTATGTIMLRGIFPNPDARIFPGFFVSVRIAGDLLEDALVVEERAVGTDLGGKYLYVVGDDDVVEQRYVELGPAEEGDVVVLKGIELGERYIVEGLLRARPGLPVIPMTQAGGA
jgi:multidrug efflux system membrane fusion protein